MKYHEVSKLPKTYKAQIPNMPLISPDIAKYVYEMYSKEHGTSQSFDRIHERGGFGTKETIYYLYAKIKEMEENTSK